MLFWTVVAGAVGLVVFALTWLQPRRQQQRDHKLQLFHELRGVGRGNYAKHLLEGTGRRISVLGPFCGKKVEARVSALIATWKAISTLDGESNVSRKTAVGETKDKWDDSHRQIRELRELLDQSLNNWWRW